MSSSFTYSSKQQRVDDGGVGVDEAIGSVWVYMLTTCIEHINRSGVKPTFLGFYTGAVDMGRCMKSRMRSNPNRVWAQVHLSLHLFRRWSNFKWCRTAVQSAQ